MILILIFIIFTIIILWQYFHQERLPNNTILAFVGTMGSGKTYLAVREGLRTYKRQKFIHIICLINPLLRPFFPKWKRKAYLYSNIPIRISFIGKRKFSYVFTKEHILRQKLLPEGAILVIDEIGQFASQWDYDNPYVKEQLADLTRFYRHWVDGRIFVTDQSSDNIVKAIRCRLGIVYHLNDFRRWFMLPFFKVDCTPLLMVEDSQKELDFSIDKRAYFYGILHYRWVSKFLKLNKYDSRCYSPIYDLGAVRDPVPYDKTLKTRYLIDISVSKSESKSYKDDRQRYKNALYTSHDDLLEEKENKKII